MKPILTEAIERAGNSFEDGELAFLGLTSKVERPFLDRLAFALHQCVPPGSLVAREFAVAGSGRADLAIVTNSAVSCIIEGKAMAVADCTRAEPRRREYALLLQRDLARYEHSPLPAAEIYCLLLGVHPLTRVPSELRAIVKYVGLLNGAFRNFKTAEGIHAEADRNLRACVYQESVVGAGAFNGGAAFGVPVEIRWWLFGAFRAPGELRLLREPAA